MVKTSSEAVRPSLNVTSQEKTSDNSLSHHGDTAIQVESKQEHDKESTSRTEDEEGEGRKDEEDYQDKDEEEAPKGPTEA